jgi:acyl-CoA thioesterase FadM
MIRSVRESVNETMPKVESYRCDPASYPHKVRVLARFADVDPLWHINNVAIAQYYEEARVSANMALGIGVGVSETGLVFAGANGPARLPDWFRARLESWLLPNRPA